MFNFDINKLRNDYSCNKCKIITENQKVLKTCGHRFCSECTQINSRCPVCNKYYKQIDINESNDFTKAVIAKMINIQKLFSEAGQPQDFSTKNLPIDIFDQLKNKESPGGDTQTEAPKANLDKIKIKVIDVEVRDVDFVCEEIGYNTIKKICVSPKRNRKGETALHLASKLGNLDKIQELIYGGEDVNIQDWGNWAPLHEAVQKGHYDCAKTLLNAGALPNIPGGFYTTPLHQSVQLRFNNITEILLRFGADPTLRDFTGQTAKDLTSDKDVIQLLESEHERELIIPRLFYHCNKQAFGAKLTGNSVDLLFKNRFHYNFDFNKDVSLIIIGSELNNKNVLLALLKSIMIVRENDLTEYIQANNPLQTKFVPEDIRNAFLRSIKNSLYHNPKLFDGMNFYVPEQKSYSIDNNIYSRKDICDLLEIGGGKLLIRPPAERLVESCLHFPFHAANTNVAKCSHFIVYDDNKAPLLLYKMPELKHVSAKWVIQCIWDYKILDL